MDTSIPLQILALAVEFVLDSKWSLVVKRDTSSPYLADPNRLADVIAAIQAMATYKFYKLDFRGWADRITGDATTADHWKYVFEGHPEFSGSIRKGGELPSYGAASIKNDTTSMPRGC